MNKVILIGNLTRDPEISSVGTGISMCKFSIAVQRRRANAEGQREADFLNCVAWRQAAENIAKYFKKGNKIAIVGAIQSRSYDAPDGTKRYVTDILVDDFEFVTPKTGGSDDDGIEDYSETTATKAPAKKQAKLEPVDDDSLPF